MPILHQYFAEVRQLRFVAFGLLKQAPVRIGRRLMGLVRPPFAVEIYGGIARDSLSVFDGLVKVFTDSSRFHSSLSRLPAR